MFHRITAIDKDGTSPNNQVQFRLLEKSGNSFTIDSQSGEIFTSEVLDRERKSSYTLMVEVTDGAPSPWLGENWLLWFVKFAHICFLSVSKIIEVHIADKNDNTPYFERNLYEAEVDENEDMGHTVLVINAQDKDECEYKI